MSLKDGRTAFVKQKFDERFNPNEEFLGLNKTVNHNEPLVSVCVPAYQHEQFIAECLESILSQKTNFTYEVLIGEDESRDRTREICKEYAKKHTDKIRLFLRDRKTSQLYDETGEFLYRFNVKWLRLSARGKYIALCEGDDYWTYKYKLQKQVDFLEDHPDYSTCFHNAKVIYTDKSDAHPFSTIKEGEYTGIQIYENRLIPTASVVFVAACAENKDYFFNSNFFFGDLVLFLTLAESGKLWYFNEIWSVYRKHEGGMMHDVFEDPENVRKFIIHQKQIIKTFPDKYKKTGHKMVSWFYFILFRKTFKKDPFGSLGSLLKSFWYSWSRCAELSIKFIRTRFGF
ncbi:MAG: glycosyltransferase [Balneolaceae bacterium]|nr:glycosyltransferase [Balneolaceae bacterium]